MVRASASQSVDLGFIFLSTLKMTCAVSLLGAWHFNDVVENKPANLFVVSLCKAL